MILLTFKDGDALRLGIKTDAGVVDVAAAKTALGDGSAPDTIDALLAGGEAAMSALTGLVGRAPTSAVRDEGSLTLGPAVPNPGKIICVGLNYRKHAEETNAPIPTSPVLFSKFNNTIAAQNEDVPLPSVAKEYDYEVELAVVIGREAQGVDEGDALNYVAGYCTANDVSCRDLQMRTSQWLLGKTLDNFFPIGPYLVTADEVSDPQALDLKCWVNGDLRQDSNTGDMIFPVDELISYISTYFPLQPGDVITTGTPSGVAMGMPNKPWLKPGDVVEVEVEGLGKLRNEMS
jgi:2-keto-4-pentenoate hydratase/2-oxohepta-3-ene-1,7-dioic acid hydratase in catechol pathway